MDTFDSHRPNVPARLPDAPTGRPDPADIIGRPAGREPRQSSLSIRVVMLRGARRYWWLVLMLWLVGSASIGVGIYHLRQAVLSGDQPPPGRPGGDRPLQRPDRRATTLDPFLQTQVQLITSPNVLTARPGPIPKASVLERIQKAGDVVQELRKVVSVSVIPGYLPHRSLDDLAQRLRVGHAGQRRGRRLHGGQQRVVRRHRPGCKSATSRPTTSSSRTRSTSSSGSGRASLRQGRPRRPSWATARRMRLGNVAKQAQDAGPNRSITVEEYRQVYRDLN